MAGGLRSTTGSVGIDGIRARQRFINLASGDARTHRAFTQLGTMLHLLLCQQKRSFLDKAPCYSNTFPIELCTAKALFRRDAIELIAEGLGENGISAILLGVNFLP